MTQTQVANTKSSEATTPAASDVESVEAGSATKQMKVGDILLLPDYSPRKFGRLVGIVNGKDDVLVDIGWKDFIWYPASKVVVAHSARQP